MTTFFSTLNHDDNPIYVSTLLVCPGCRVTWVNHGYLSQSSQHVYKEREYSRVGMTEGKPSTGIRKRALRSSHPLSHHFSLKCNTCFPSLKKEKSTLYHTVRQKTIFSSQTVDVPEKCRPHSEGMHNYGQRPQSTLQRDFNHTSVELSLHGKTTKRLLADKWWGNRKELPLVTLSAVVGRIWSRVIHWASITKWGVYTLTSPSMSLFRRMVLLLKSEISWEKIYPQGLDEDRRRLFSISSPKQWADSWRKWHWTCIKFSCFD